MMETLAKQELRLSIADITFKMTAALTTEKTFNPPPAVATFIGGGEPDVSYNIHYGPLPEIALGDQVFESGGLWRLYQNNGTRVITCASSALGEAPYKIAVLSEDFTSGDVYLNADLGLDMQLAYPLEYPLDELLMINLLCRGRGLEVHACGVDDRGEGLVFLGVSGAGKSTLANLWKAHQEVNILSDDRIIVRKKSDGYWIYGTPWHGDAAVAAKGGARLKRLYFIVQSPENYIKPLPAGKALGRLLVRSFPTFWDKAGRDFVMNFGADLCAEIGCFELGVMPDQEIIKFIREKAGA